jgi:hypothetical protein
MMTWTTLGKRKSRLRQAQHRMMMTSSRPRSLLVDVDGDEGEGVPEEDLLDVPAWLAALRFP